MPGQAPSRGTLSGTHVRGVSITQAPAGLRCLGLVGPDVARALLWAVGSLVAPLVRRGTKRTRKRDIITGRATFEQGHRLSPPAIARQWAKLGVGVLHAARAGQAATAIARQVVALIGVAAKAKVNVGAVAARVFGDDAPADIDLSVKGEEAAALAAVSRVAGEGAVADRQFATIVEEAAAAGSGVAGEGAVADAQRAAEVVEAAAAG